VLLNAVQPAVAVLPHVAHAFQIRAVRRQAPCH
jgi:hypothetical protein